MNRILDVMNNISKSLTVKRDIPGKNSVVSQLCEVAQQGLHGRHHALPLKVASLADLGGLGTVWEEAV